MYPRTATKAPRLAGVACAGHPPGKMPGVTLSGPWRYKNAVWRPPFFFFFPGRSVRFQVIIFLKDIQVYVYNHTVCMSFWDTII